MRLDERNPVINNIKRAVAEGDFYRKTELHDAVLDKDIEDRLVTDFARNRHSLVYKFKNLCANIIADGIKRNVAKTTDIVGLENVADIKGGAIVSVNHFNPDDNCTIRMLADYMKRKKLVVVSQASNFMAHGWQGFLLKYIDAIPMSRTPAYLGGMFEQQLREKLADNRLVLMYCEQEMWFNYRKPRIPKRGVYHYAAKLQVPVISCFVEMRDIPGTLRDDFTDVAYTLHVLKPIFPNPAKPVKENSIDMAAQDYAQKKAAYEQAYGKPLDYTFETTDIAGWHPTAQ
ncbi:MAG: 1-acyl-sn-glycerol-3-phosphate acyltransferase [Paludibacteraceae bacterium]|nr:1-acyl-sn-glycerol-3-phosphate acyltransferase [Paludibacteraceae bacterium]